MNHRIRLHFPQQRQVFVSQPFNPESNNQRGACKADVWWQASAHGLCRRNQPTLTEEHEDGSPIVPERKKAVQVEMKIV